MGTESDALVEKFRQALALHNKGQLRQAEVVYEEILQTQPRHFDALHMLGIAAGQRGEPQAAVALFSQAIAVSPDQPATYADRGIALHSLGRLEEALTSFDQALALRPGYPDALNCRGIVLRGLKRFEEALASYDRALALQPDRAEVLCNRGFVLQTLGRFEEALTTFDRALALRPDDPQALNNRGASLQNLGRFEEALATFDQSLAIRPDSTEVLYNRGLVLQRLNGLEDALASFDRALAINPDYAEVLCIRGNVLVSLRRFDQALESYTRALAIRPDYPDLFGTWLITKMTMCDWAGLNTAFERLAADVNAGKRSAPPLVLMSTPLSLPLQRKCAELYVQDKFPARADLRDDGLKALRDRIRLGYFSADFHKHPVAYLTAGLFETHDRSRFELIAFSFGPPAPKGAMRARLKAAFDQFIDVRQKSEAEIALLARSLDIDIAVDLMGFTVNSRTGVFARRAAPIQVNYLGYPGTMGASYIDYLIADQAVIPREHAAHYAERIVYLPHTFQANDSRRAIADRQFTRQDVGLPGQGFVFCNFNHSYKIIPNDFDCWMRLLKKVEGSILWLAGTNATAEDNLRKEARARHVAPDRLIFKQRTDLLSDHLAQLRLADLFLDSSWFNAHTTASDALWAGLPVLTRLGETYASRVAASLLKAVGLPELITESPEAYEALALGLARDAPGLAALKQRLAENRLTYPLFDTALFTRHIEAAYLAMWERHRAGLPPEHIVVPP